MPDAAVGPQGPARSVEFVLPYRTTFGESVCLLRAPEPVPLTEEEAISGSGGLEVLRISATGNGDDQGLTVSSLSGLVRYKYGLLNDQTGKVVAVEFGDPRTVDLDALSASGAVAIKDFWRPMGRDDNALYSSFFVDGCLRPDPSTQTPPKAATANSSTRAAVFRIRCPRIETGDRVAVFGSAAELGSWDAAKAVPMFNPDHPLWQTAPVAVPEGIDRIEYKYLVQKADGQVIIEDGSNRVLYLAPHTTVVTDEGFRFTTNWRGAGVAIPVFSLRTKNSFGVGEFMDLIPMVDWAKEVGLKVVQILPINDTVATHRWMDSYPYAGISVFALHPQYLNLHAIGNLSASTTQLIIDSKGSSLNELEEIDYEEMMKLKSRFYKLIYDETKSTFLSDPEYVKWFASNKEWLLPYAVFSYLRDLYLTPDFTKWDKYSKPTMAEIEDLASPERNHFDDVAVHFFIQYHLHRQLLTAVKYAKKNGVCLKGDIPIGIFRHSVDAWVTPHLFNMDMQAGAPPDDFATDGQNWGFPTYNWDEMAKDGFLWWRRRLYKMAEYFDAFRIDHILGFFRIWQIPTDSVTGLMGYFNPATPIHVDEIKGRGIAFDYDRFCTPYIREYVLRERFAPDVLGDVKALYLDYIGGDGDGAVYKLKEAVDTQRKAANLLATTEDMSIEKRSYNNAIKRGLWSLHSEVLHSLHKSASFQGLDDHSKGALMALYNDYFFNRQEVLWREKAMVKLPAIKSATQMLICAEDLGMVPACVPGVLQELSILRLAIQRMPPDPSKTFWDPMETPYLCVASPSSHDMSGLRGWWEEDRAVTERFWHEILRRFDDVPYYCEPWVVRDIIASHLWAPCMLAIFPIQDLVAMDGRIRREDPREEQINVPANPTHYWRYRFHINLEDLVKDKEFCSMVGDMVLKSGRGHAY
ncbi:4-alpha-glucanotransferase [Hyaloraphidium curvatum]|nr:4-alpha-glucanotransferase [Hyaloraphidium curvatum]